MTPRFSSEADRLAVVNIPAIREWRAAQHAKGEERSGLNDYFVVHNICLLCTGHGRVVTRWDGNRIAETGTCPRCGGSGGLL